MTDMTDAQTTTNQTNENTQDAILAELLSKISAPRSSQSSAPTGANGGIGGGVGGDLLSSLLSNPELIAKIPSIISSVKPLLDMLGSQMGQSSPTTAQAASIQAPPTQSSGATVPASITKGKDSDRAALLCAMKPYLSRDRQNAIDHIIKLSRLGDVLKSL